MSSWKTCRRSSGGVRRPSDYARKPAVSLVAFANNKAKPARNGIWTELGDTSMKWTVLAALPLLAVLVVPLAAQESIRLRIEMYKNGSQVAAPTTTVQERATGTLKVESVAKVSITPSRVAADGCVGARRGGGERTMRPPDRPTE